MNSFEVFDDSQTQILKQYVTSTTNSIFALKNLPEVIKGALFSRYSRSTLGLRSLLLKEFIQNNDETNFSEIAGSPINQSNELEQTEAIIKAQNFYDRILDGYGDDSIGELGGAHLAVEQVSMLATKVIEDCRIGGSPLEKSTRYIYFDQKINGSYAYYKEPILMTSAYRDLFTQTCDFLFDTYSKLIPPLTEMIAQKTPRGHEVSKVAYTAALRAKVLDVLRGLLPAGTLTNLGIYGNGRFYETLIQKLHMSSLSEMQDIGKNTYDALHQVIPSFVRRAEKNHRHFESFAKYTTECQLAQRQLQPKYVTPSYNKDSASVRLVSFNKNDPAKVASHLLFSHSHESLTHLEKIVENLNPDQIGEILDSVCAFRQNRRHKSPRALEQASFTFEIIADYGIYRDLHRHRTLTQERQLLTCDYGYDLPHEILGTELEADYLAAMKKAKEAFDQIREHFPEEAQYLVPMAYNIRFYFHINLRALQWLTELRSQAAGHVNYRFVAQEMAKLVIEAIPEFERFFKFVDYEGHELGRLSQEIKTAEKLKNRALNV
jgi:thymidylate synthase ThyX